MGECADRHGEREQIAETEGILQRPLLGFACIQLFICLALLGLSIGRSGAASSRRACGVVASRRHRKEREFSVIESARLSKLVIENTVLRIGYRTPTMRSTIPPEHVDVNAYTGLT